MGIAVSTHDGSTRSVRSKTFWNPRRSRTISAPSVKSCSRARLAGFHSNQLPPWWFFGASKSRACSGPSARMQSITSLRAFLSGALNQRRLPEA